MPPFKNKLHSCNEDSAQKRSIQNTANDESGCTAANIGDKTRGKVIYILPSGIVSYNALPGWLGMNSNPRCMKVHFFKSIDTLKWKLWRGSNPNILYAIDNRFFRSSFGHSIKEGHPDNDIALRASFNSPVIILCSSTVRFLPIELKNS